MSICLFSFQPGGFQDRAARAGRHFFRAVEIYSNQARMASFGIVANRAFLFDQPKPACSSSRAS
jgi:hypothetical protein